MKIRLPNSSFDRLVVNQAVEDGILLTLISVISVKYNERKEEMPACVNQRQGGGGGSHGNRPLLENANANKLVFWYIKCILFNSLDTD